MNAPARHRVWTIGSPCGVNAKIVNLGASIAELNIPTKHGHVNVVLGYACIVDYLCDPFYMGAAAGRFCNRIARGRFTLNDIIHQLSLNEGDNHLHGGHYGVSKRYWKCVDYTNDSITMLYHSPHKEEGYPGDLDVKVTYRCTADGFEIDYHAATSQDTIINLTSHPYFNLSGQDISALDHEITINADTYTPVDENCIPTGEFRAVDRTPFDFRKPRKINSVIRRRSKQLTFGSGFDHNFVVNPHGLEDQHVASAHSRESGIRMHVFSNQPGVQFYSGNFLSEPFVQHQGFCLETQNYPDAPNKPHFPDAILRAGDEFTAKTRYAFELA